MSLNIVWFSWKDIKHPLAGGAEVVSDSLRKKLAANGHTVTLITASYSGAIKNEKVDNIHIHRSGGRIGVYLKAWLYYRKYLKHEPDLVIDEMNTIPFFAGLYSKQRTVLLTYQLARRVWFYQMIFPFSVIGFLLEPLYLRILATKYRLVLTESQSTKNDLVRHGFKDKCIHTFRVGMEMKSPKVIPEKNNLNTILFLGALRPMKQPLEAVKAFEHAHKQIPSLRFIIAGDNSGKYAEKVLRYISRSTHKNAIQVLGRVDNETKLTLLKNAALILVTSAKEGWGLIVTEANSQGTPAIAYDTDGLRDSVLQNETGILVEKQNPVKMSMSICDLLKDRSKYELMQTKAFAFSKQFTFSNSYEDFMKIIQGYADEKGD